MGLPARECANAAFVFVLTLLLSGCTSDITERTKADAGKEARAETFELVDRKGNKHLLTDVHSCATIDRETGEKSCDFRYLYLLSDDIHYQFAWTDVRSLQREEKRSGDVFRVTLKGGKSEIGTFDQAPAEGRQPKPVGPSNSLSGRLVEMGGNTAIFPTSVIASLRRIDR